MDETRPNRWRKFTQDEVDSQPENVPVEAAEGPDPSLPAERLLVALDFSDPLKAKNLAAELAPLGVGFKIGLELYMAGGPALLEELASRYRIFLDLKFHDIPNTVSRAVKRAAAMGVWMVNVHASGGKAMLEAAREALAETGGRRPLLFAVTVLTSMDEQALAETGCSLGVQEQVMKLAALAEECKLDGVVCSPLEVISVKKKFPGELLTVTPGIRPAGTEHNDQSRVAAPKEVIRAGGDYLVAGRPVTGAAKPFVAAEKIIREMGAE